MRPYIGITGVTDATQMEEISNQFETHLKTVEIPHQGMVGVLCSHDTVEGRQRTNRHIADISALQRTMMAAKGILPMLHVEIDKRTGNRTPFAHNISTLLDCIGRNDIAVQLNGAPDFDEIDMLRDEHPGIVIVLQLRQELLKLGVPKVVEFLSDAGAGAHAGYTLIDPSAGTGRGFNVEFVGNLQQMIAERYPKQTVGAAGGLRPDSVNYWTRQLVSTLGGNAVCVDVETGVRNEENDDLSMEKTGVFIAEAVLGLQGKTHD